jgi:SAM-dependent methyltransferase
MRLNSPLSATSVDLLIQWTAPKPGERILDLGCGQGAILQRFVEQTGAEGLGVDRDPALLARAIRHPRLRWQEADLRSALPEGSWDVVLCVGSLDALGDGEEAWARLAGLVRPGGRAVVGRLVWEQPPSADYLEASGLAADAWRYTDRAGTAAQGERAGLRYLTLYRSTTAEWDRFEGDSMIRRVREASDPERQEALARWRWARLRGGLQSMGFACFIFDRPAPAG